MANDTSRASAQATLDHIERLLAKRDKLNDAIREAVDALGPQIRRTDWTLAEAADLYRRAKEHKGPKFGLTDTVADSLSYGRDVLSWHIRHPEGYQLKGPLPLPHDPSLPAKNLNQHTVYLLLTDEGYCLYVGTSCQVTNRIRGHIREGRIPATRYEVILCEDKASALSLEGDLIFQHKPPYNRAGVKTRRHSGSGVAA